MPAKVDRTDKRQKKPSKSDSEDDKKEEQHSEDEQETHEEEHTKGFETNEPEEHKIETPVENKPKSVINFDASDVLKFNDRLVKDTPDIELLKILIVRGKENHNPSQWKGAERLLQQLNGESLHERGRGNPRFGNNGRRDNSGRGSFQPRNTFYQGQSNVQHNFTPQNYKDNFVGQNYKDTQQMSQGHEGVPQRFGMTNGGRGGNWQRDSERHFGDNTR
jgi:hypothetical protein